MTEKTIDETILRRWVGKSETTVDTLHPAQARLMQATLDRTPSLLAGDPLPPTWHWSYFLSGVPLSDLGRDGHPALGGFLPPVILPRRMWAGGRLHFEIPVLLGETITKTSTIKDVVVKSGRSGSLCFVTVAHHYSGPDKETRFTEEHDIVYREDPSPNDPKPQPPAPLEKAKRSETITPQPVQLFRYSALTFNSHRIHYDRDYCQNIEGYPGLVFHGPLTATLLADMAHRAAQGALLKSFSFRAVSSLFDTAAFTINTDGGLQFWAENPNKQLAMKADVTYQN